jgi:dTDP-4-amino-4,6-dideoxygalactose transaminase
MMASRDAGVVDRARKRSQQSREPVIWYEHEALGYNYRMSNIVAAIGVGQLSYLGQIIEKKRQIFEWYRQKLSGVMGLSFMPEAAYGRCTRWLTVIEFKNEAFGFGSCGTGTVEQKAGNRGAAVKDGRSGVGKPSAQVMRVIEALERGDIESRPVWKPMHLQPVFRCARVYGGNVSERVFLNGICLPSGTGLEETDVCRVSAVIGQSVHELCGCSKCD